jgi:hypothetical protein
MTAKPTPTSPRCLLGKACLDSHCTSPYLPDHCPYRVFVPVGESTRHYQARMKREAK